MSRLYLYLCHLHNDVASAGRWLLARLKEPTTWTGIVTAATSVAALSPPLSYVGFAAGVLGVMLRKGPTQ